MLVFYQNKKNDLLTLRCTLPKVANIYLHNSSDVKIYHLREGEKHLLEEIRKTGGAFLHAYSY